MYGLEEPRATRKTKYVRGNEEVGMFEDGWGGGRWCGPWRLDGGEKTLCEQRIGGSEWRSGSVWAHNLSVRNEMVFRLWPEETGKRGPERDPLTDRMGASQSSIKRNHGFIVERKHLSYSSSLSLKRRKVELCYQL